MCNEQKERRKYTTISKTRILISFKKITELLFPFWVTLLSRQLHFQSSSPEDGAYICNVQNGSTVPYQTDEWGPRGVRVCPSAFLMHRNQIARCLSDVFFVALALLLLLFRRGGQSRVDGIVLIQHCALIVIEGHFHVCLVHNRSGKKPAMVCVRRKAKLSGVKKERKI